MVDRTSVEVEQRIWSLPGSKVNVDQLLHEPARLFLPRSATATFGGDHDDMDDPFCCCGDRPSAVAGCSSSTTTQQWAAETTVRPRGLTRAQSSLTKTAESATGLRSRATDLRDVSSQRRRMDGTARSGPVTGHLPAPDTSLGPQDFWFLAWNRPE